MSRTKVCIPSENPKLAACGAPYQEFVYCTPYCRAVITCKKCRKTPAFKNLPTRGFA